jgi:hypothetical protein
MPERAGGMQRPVGIPQQLAREDDEVGLAHPQDVLGLFGRRDEARGGGGNAGRPPHLRREPGPIGMTACATFPPDEQSMASTCTRCQSVA